MTRGSVFMIFLMLCISCKEEPAHLQFEGSEALMHTKIQEDFEPPHYKWGYLNEDGQLVIEDKYDDLREFNEGIAAFNKNGLWGYLNKSGTEVLPARFLSVAEFNEGIGISQDLNQKFHLFDTNFQPIKDSLEYDQINKFCNDRALIEKNRRYGYLDKSGSETITPQYEYASDFNDGMAIVTQNGLQGIIDVNNKPIIPISYDKIWFPAAGFIRFKKDKKYGFMDVNGEIIISNQYHSATDFQEEHTIVNDGDKYHLINKSGQKTLLPYTLVDTGGEGKWMYATDSRFGFLNNDGSVLCPPNYDLVMRYKEGRAGFAINDIWGYLDDKGEIIIPPIYPLVWDFVDDHARMIGRTGFGFIDKQGHNTHPPRYMEVRDFSEGLARIQVYR